MPEWLMGADCKSVDLVFVGSNPTRPNFLLNFRLLAKTNLLCVYLLKVVIRDSPPPMP